MGPINSIRPSRSTLFPNAPLRSTLFPNAPLFIDSLTNSGQAGFFPGMNIPTAESSNKPAPLEHISSGIVSSLGEYDEFDDDPDTDGFIYNNENIFEESGFLGIRIGKKAKARGAVKKAAKVARREARRAPDESITDSVWDGSSSIAPEPSPVLAANPVLPDYETTVPVIAQKQLNSGYNEEYSPEGLQPQAESPNKKLLMYGGIAAAVLLIILLIVRK